MRPGLRWNSRRDGVASESSDAVLSRLRAENADLARELELVFADYRALATSRTLRIARAVRGALRPFAAWTARFDPTGREARAFEARMRRFPVLTERLGLRSVPIRPPTRLNACNPSLLAMENGWLALIRAHNYRKTDNGRRMIFDGPELENEMWLAELDEDLAIRRTTRLEPEWEWGTAPWQAQLMDPARNGSEDGRLIRLAGEVRILATAASDWLQANTMALGRHIDGRLCDIVMLDSPIGERREKNWMPVVLDGRLCAVYRIQPFRLVELTRPPRTIEAHADNAGLEAYSGSSQLIDFEGGWLCVLHRREIHRAGVFYVHKLVVLDSRWRISAHSPDFFFEHRAVEFCAGLAVKGDRFVFSFGVNSSDPSLLELSRAEVETLLRG